MSRHDAETPFVPASPWHTAGYSVERGECVEVSEGPTTGVRDTVHRDHGAFTFTAAEWRVFLQTTQDTRR